MFDFLKIKQAVEGLADEITGLRAQLEEKKRRSEKLQAASLHPEDQADQIDALIDAAGAEWPKRLHATLAPLRRKPLREPDLKQIPLLAVVGKPDSAPHFMHLEAALFAIFGDPIKQAVRAQILSWDSAGAGPRLAERKAELAKLDEEIAELEQREQKLVDEARAAGIRI